MLCLTSVDCTMPPSLPFSLAPLSWPPLISFVLQRRANLAIACHVTPWSLHVNFLNFHVILLTVLCCRYGGVTFGDNFKNMPKSFTQTNLTSIQGILKEHNAKVKYVISSFSHFPVISSESLFSRGNKYQLMTKFLHFTRHQIVAIGFPLKFCAGNWRAGDQNLRLCA